MSKNSTFTLRDFSRQLLAVEAETKKSAPAESLAAFRVCGKLRRLLTKFMGAGGLRALQARALVLAGVEIPWLRDLSLNEDSSLEGLEILPGSLDSVAIAEGEIVLVAELLGLLTTFIGPTLTLTLVQKEWPNAEFEDGIFRNRESL